MQGSAPHTPQTLSFREKRREPHLQFPSVSRNPDLNWGPTDYESVALPTELSRHAEWFIPCFHPVNQVARGKTTGHLHPCHLLFFTAMAAWAAARRAMGTRYGEQET